VSEGAGRHKAAALRAAAKPAPAAAPEATAPRFAVPLPSRPEERRRIRDLAPGLFASVCIAGSSSNAGKTWLCERVIEALKRAGETVAALKVTRTHEARCPRENDSCGVCDGLEQPWRVIVDRPSLDVPRKDTGRYFAAGADHVTWLVVQPRHVRDGIAAALGTLPAGSILVAEGNSVRDYAEPDLSLMALTGRFAPKPSAETILDRIDAFVTREGDAPRARAWLDDRGLSRTPAIDAGQAAAWVLDRLASLRAGRRG
jgi:hypothetical protein